MGLVKRTYCVRAEGTLHRGPRAALPPPKGLQLHSEVWVPLQRHCYTAGLADRKGDKRSPKQQRPPAESGGGSYPSECPGQRGRQRA